MTAITEDLKITTTNQEAVDETIALTVLEEGVATPMDLTDATFLSEVKAARDIASAAMATITVTVVGDPTDGVVRLQIAEDIMKTVAPGKWWYDFNIKIGAGEPDCIWISTFLVEAGVSLWP